MNRTGEDECSSVACRSFRIWERCAHKRIRAIDWFDVLRFDSQIKVCRDIVLRVLLYKGWHEVYGVSGTVCVVHPGYYSLSKDGVRDGLHHTSDQRWMTKKGPRVHRVRLKHSNYSAKINRFCNTTSIEDN